MGPWIETQEKTRQVIGANMRKLCYKTDAGVNLS